MLLRLWLQEGTQALETKFHQKKFVDTNKFYTTSTQE